MPDTRRFREIMIEMKGIKKVCPDCRNPLKLIDFQMTGIDGRESTMSMFYCDMCKEYFLETPNE